MDQLPHRISSWWRGLAPDERWRASILASISLAYVGHYLVYCIPQPFYIEDAGISFAYARNLVEGHGFVTYAGGERVEGFSNGVWTFLVALFYALGVPTWSSSKIMGAVFGVMTLPIVYALVRRARPADAEGNRPSADVALVAPLLLAASPQFVIWNASGLENSQYVLLLAAGMLRLVQEGEDEGKRPWSALIFALISMSRPEGIMYAAIALAVVTVQSLATRRFLALLTWILLLVAPLAAWHGWRLWYFAWPHPNTYYAKVLESSFKPYGWTLGGWKYINNYLLTSGTAWALPLLIIGMSGLSGRRRWLASATLVVLPVLIFWNGREGLPYLPNWWRPVANHWVQMRVWTILGLAVVMGLTTLTRPGWRARGLMWSFAAANAFFIIYANADWMKGFRFFSFSTVSFLPLLCVGLGELLDELPVLLKRIPLPPKLSAQPWTEHVNWRLLLIAAPTIALVVVSGINSGQFSMAPETAVRDVHRRVTYMSWVQKRLDLDHVVLLDVDMGAHMYFTDWEIVDIAGLVDMPIAHHRDYDKKFMAEYLWKERNPDFAHVHAGWARSSKIPTYKEWKDRYLEIPGYPSGGKALHVGNHVRRDLFIDTVTGPLPASVARFAGGVQLMALDAPSPLVAPGGELHLDTAWNAAFREDGFRILAVLDGVDGEGKGTRTVAALPPGYDWYKPEDWKRTEVVRGHYRVPIPDGLATGTYQLSLALLDEKSGKLLRVLAPGEADPDPQVDKSPIKKKAIKPPPRRPNQVDDEEEAEGGPVVEDVAEADEGEDEGDLAADDAADDAADEGGDAEDVLGEDPSGELGSADSAAPTPPGSTYLPGSWTTPVLVKVVSYASAEGAAAADLEAARAYAGAGQCEQAWTEWKNATRHISRNSSWQETREPALRRAIADCYVARAAAAEDREARADALVTAARYAVDYGPQRRPAAALAVEYDASGDAAAKAEDWETAYTNWTRALALDPSLSWTRRKAEDARDRRLKIGAYKPATPVKADKSSKDKSKDKDTAEKGGEGKAEEGGAEGGD